MFSMINIKHINQLINHFWKFYLAEDQNLNLKKSKTPAEMKRNPYQNSTL